jgi:flagellar basal body-associated protein FliL
MQKIPENKARQGRSGKRVFVILIVSLVLLAIGWGAVEFYGEAIDETTPGSDQTQTNG